MADFAFNSLCYDLGVNDIKFDTDSFKMMLLTSAYTPDRGDKKRSELTTYEATGAGYSAGGKSITVILQNPDDINNRVDVTLPASTTWSSSTITARYAVIYKSRGGSDTLDELICLIDFTTDQSSESGNFIVYITQPLRFQYS